MNKPLPLVVSCVVCEEIYINTARKKHLLTAPCNGVKLRSYPGGFHLGLYIQLMEGYGAYHLDLELRNEEGDVIWQHSWADINFQTPLQPHTLFLNEIPLPFPAPGRYDLVVQANGEDLAQHPLWAELV